MDVITPFLNTEKTRSSMISRTALFVAALSVVSAPSYGQIIELTHDEPFTGEKIFCVEVTGTSGKDGYFLTFILSLADKDVPIKYMLNGRLMKDFTADYEFKGRQQVPGTGKYTFTYVTTAKTTIKKFEVQGDSAESSATLSSCT
jgi:hypothetical protein